MDATPWSGMAWSATKKVKVFPRNAGEHFQHHRGYMCGAWHKDENGQRIIERGCFHQKRGAARKHGEFFARLLNKEQGLG